MVKAILAVLLLSSCVSSSPPEPQRPAYVNPALVNIRAVSHPLMIQGLTLLHGETISSALDDVNRVGAKLAEQYAAMGYRDLVIYPELVANRGITPQAQYHNPSGGFLGMMQTQMAVQGYAMQASRQYVWQIAIYQAP